MKKFYIAVFMAHCFFVSNAYATTINVGSMVFISKINEGAGNHVNVSGAFSGDNASVSNGVGEAAASSEQSQLTYAKEAELIRQRYSISGSDAEVMMGSYRQLWETEVGYNPAWFSQNPHVWDKVSHTPSSSISNATAGAAGVYDPGWNVWLSPSLTNEGGATRSAYFEGTTGGVFPATAEGIGDGSTALYMNFTPGTYSLSINYNLWASSSGMESASLVDLRAFVESSFSIIDDGDTTLHDVTLEWLSPAISELTITQSGGPDFNDFRSGTFMLNLTTLSNISGILEFSTLAEGSLTTSSQIEPPQPVPEPATLLLMGTGLAGLIGVRRKMKDE